MTYSCNHALFPAALILAMASPALHAADGTWLGTSGNWSDSGTWVDGIVADGTGFTASFTGVDITANQTITIDTPRTIGNITFTDATAASNNLILSGSEALTLDVAAGAPLVDVTQSGRTITLSSPMAGADGLAKSGAGQLILSGDNTGFSGPVTVNGGILNLGNTGALGTASGIALAGGTRLIPSVDGVTITAPIALGAAGTTATINAPAFGTGGGNIFNVNVEGAISGDGNLTLLGTQGSNVYGTVVLKAANTYAGTTLMTCDIANNNKNIFVRLATHNGLPTTTVLTMDGNSGSGSGRTCGLNLDGFNQTLAGLTNITRNLRTQRIYSSSAATLTIDNSDDYTFSGLIGTGGTNVALTKNGTGTFTLTRVNTYTGATTINNGSLVGVTGGSSAASAVTVGNPAGTLGISINNNANVWTCSSLTFTAAGGLRFDYGAIAPSDTVAPLVVTGAADFTATPTVIVGGSSLVTLPLGSYPLMTWGSVTGTVPTDVVLPPTMDGTLTVTGNTLYLNVTKASALPVFWATGDGAWDIDISANWKDSAGGFSTYEENLAGSASVVFEDLQSGPGAAIAVNLPADVKPADTTIDNTGKNFSFSGPGIIGGTGGLTKNGSAIVTMSLANTYAGATVISNGTFKLGTAQAIPDGAGKGNLTLDGTLDLNGFSETVNGLSGFGSIDTLAGGSPVLTVGNANSSGTFDGIIGNTAGTLGLVKTGSGTLTLAGANTYAGNTEIAGGIVIANQATALGSGTVTFNGGTRLVVGNGLDLANDIIIGTNVGVAGRGLLEAAPISGTSTLSGDITINSGASAGGHFAAPTAGTVLDVRGAITSPATVSLRAGSVMFSGGGTGYAALGVSGTAMVGAANGIATTASVDLGAYGAAGTLDLNGLSQSLTGVTKGANAATIGNSSTASDSILTLTGTSTFAGVIQDAIGGGDKKLHLAVASGSLTLAGANSYSGNTTVESGATLALADNAQLKFVLGATSGTSNSLTGAGTATLDGDFVIDTTAADALTSGTWTLEDVAGLAGAYGATFTVAGFTDAGGDKWTKANGATTYTFDEATGVLTLTAGGFTSWISGTFAGGATVPLDQQGEDADFDKDGISNLLEYALAGQDPTVPNPVAGTTVGNQVSFAKRPDATGLSYVIQESTDLGDQDAWAEVGSYDENSASTISHTLTPGSPARNFVRLLVTQN